MKRRIAFSFLDEIKRLWRQDYASIEQSAIAFSLNDRFSPVLQHQIVTFNVCMFLLFCYVLFLLQERFNSDPSADNINRVKDQLETVKEVMVQNIGYSVLLADILFDIISGFRSSS
jgi:hypothetical protein